MHTLQDLLRRVDRDLFVAPPPLIDPPIERVTDHSADVAAFTLFVAVRGEKRDAHEFIPQAFAQGAAFVLGESPPDSIPEAYRAKYAQVRSTKTALGILAAQFYGEPSRSLLVIGVTGTSGKTTTTYLIESILKSAGHRVGVIGTVNFRIEEMIFESTHTTPGAIELQRMIAEMKRNGCTALVMEVSSHALKQHRADGIAFDGVVFTNLSPEHLDYHPDLEDYYQSKKLLFTRLRARAVAAGKSPVTAINADDSAGARLLAELKTEVGFTLPSDLALGSHGITGTFSGIGIRSLLIARFNAENIAAAVAVCARLGIAEAAIREGIETLTAVPGRLERIEPAKGRIVLVDYAHKSDALAKVLETLNAIRGDGKLITVFGCGGDRDRLKRPAMGEIATRLSNETILTTDNPRSEDPVAILQEIEAGIPRERKYRVESDRRAAIALAFAISRPGDWILIAGKGHETYQIIPTHPGAKTTKKMHFDDREEARMAASRDF